MSDWSTLPIEVRRCPVHYIPDCSPLLNGCSIPNQMAAIYKRGQSDAEARAYEQGVRDAHNAIADAPFGWVGKVEAFDENARLVKECREHDQRLVLALLERAA